MSITDIKVYNWGILWEVLNNKSIDSLDDSQKLLKAFLLGFKWKCLNEASQILNKITNKDSYYIWVLLMIELANGKGENFDQYIQYCNESQIDNDLLNWAMIDYCGRTKDFKTQANILKNAIVTNNKLPYIAFIYSTEYKNFNPKEVCEIFDLNDIIATDNIEKILFKIKLLENLKKTDELKEFINSCIDTSSDPIKTSILISRLYVINAKDNIYEDSLLYLDLMAKISYINYDTIIDWIKDSIAKEPNQANTKERINKALRVIPKNLDYMGGIVSFGLIYFWINEDINNLNNTLNQFKEYGYSKHIKKEPWLQIYFNYIKQLTNYRVKNHHLYISENKQTSTLHVIGESHSLALNALSLKIDEDYFKAKTHLVIGVKMFHINKNKKNRHKTNLTKLLSNIEENSSLLFTIGEIDCRPNEGIWSAYKKNNQNLDKLIKETVYGYIDCLKEEIKNKSFNKIIIQGVPNRKYTLEGKLMEENYSDYFKEEEFKLYKEMIEKVNFYLKEFSNENNWYFLDLYKASKEEDIFIDSTHVKPSFYKSINKYLSCTNN